MNLKTLIRQRVRAALKRHKGKIAPAARELGISRQTLHKWIYKGVQPGIAFRTPKLKNFLREHVRHVLRKHDYARGRFGMVSRTARELGIPRSTLYAWMRAFGFLMFGRVQYESPDRAYARERRKMIAGCGQMPVQYFGELDATFSERMHEPWGVGP